VRKLPLHVRKQAKHVGKLAKRMLTPSKTEKMFVELPWMKEKPMLTLPETDGEAL
jgi:hypothetical protein